MSWLRDQLEYYEAIKKAQDNAEEAYRNMIDVEKYRLMAKKDAIKVLNNIVFGLVDTVQAERWIDALECLGLIKFKEEPLIFNDILRSFGITDTKKFQEIIEANGYKIQKVG